MLNFNPKFYGKVKDGKLVLDEQDTFRQWIKEVFREDQQLEILVRKPSEKQTVRQYRYLYACIYKPFADEFGWRIDEVDEYMKKSFMQAYQISLPEGITLSKAANFNKLWLSRYIDFCIQESVEKGVTPIDIGDYK